MIEDIRNQWKKYKVERVSADSKTRLIDRLVSSYYAIEEVYNDISKKYLSYYNQDNIKKDISYDTKKLFAKEYILNNIEIINSNVRKIPPFRAL